MPAKKKIVKKSKPGLYANIRAKRARIAKGSGEHMRQAGTPGAPSSEAFEKSTHSAGKSKQAVAHNAARKTAA